MNTKRIWISIPLLVLLVCITNVYGQDWPQYLGPDRNSSSSQEDVLHSWPDDGPEVLWKVDVGIGFGGPVARDGKVYILERRQPEVIEQKISDYKIEDEVIRFQLALITAREQLKEIRVRIPTSTPTDIAALIYTHLLMLKDSALVDAPIDLILIRKLNAEWAWKLQRDALVNFFEEMDDA